MSRAFTTTAGARSKFKLSIYHNQSANLPGAQFPAVGVEMHPKSRTICLIRVQVNLWASSQRPFQLVPLGLLPSTSAGWACVGFDPTISHRFDFVFAFSCVLIRHQRCVYFWDDNDQQTELEYDTTISLYIYCVKEKAGEPMDTPGRRGVASIGQRIHKQHEMSVGLACFSNPHLHCTLFKGYQRHISSPSRRASPFTTRI